MAQVDGEQQQQEPVLSQEEASATNLEAISAAIEAVGVAMADLNSAAAANPEIDNQWDVIKAAADAPAKEIEKTEAEAKEEAEVIPPPNEAQPVEAVVVVEQAIPVEIEKIEENVDEKVDEKPEEKVEQPVHVEEFVQEPVQEPVEEPVRALIEEQPQGQAAVVDEQKIEEQTELNKEQPVEEKIEEPTEEPTASPAEEPTVQTLDDPTVISEGPIAPVAIEETNVEDAPDDPNATVEQPLENEDVASADVKVVDETLDNDSEIIDEEIPDQYSDYCGGDMDEVSLSSCSTETSQNIKKKGRVMGGFRSIASGFKDITVGTGRNVSKTSKKAANVGHSTIQKGANAVADGARSAASGTASGVRAVGSGVKSTGVNFAKATAGSITDVGQTTKKAATGTKDAVVTGVCIGVGSAVLAGQAIGQGTQRAAGAITDGTVAVASSVAGGVKAAGGAVVDGAKSAGNAVAEVATSAAQGVRTTATNVVATVGQTIDETLDTGKRAIQSVEQGIENAALRGAAAVQQSTVKALTLGLQLADPSIQVVPKAIEAPAPPPPIAAPEEATN